MFESDKKAVEAKLGSGTEVSRNTFRYDSDRFVVTVSYSGERCSAKGTALGGFDVPEGTVLDYRVGLRQDLDLKELRWNRKDYVRSNDPHMVNFVHYTNEKDAIRIVTREASLERKEYVHILYFNQSAEQIRRYKCKD